MAPRALAWRGPPAYQSNGPLSGETSCLSLVCAVLDLFFCHASNGATFTDFDRQHLYRIKYQPAEPATFDEEVPPHNSSREPEQRRTTSAQGTPPPMAEIPLA